MTEVVFPEILSERLWHTTNQNRFESILASKAILPNPAIADSERWKTSRGPEFYPYARILEGVSLFDFRGFEPEAYSAKFPMSAWQTFIPYRCDWGAAIWLEVDRALVAGRYIDPPQFLARWKSDGAYKHTIMPMIEGAHIGSIPLRAVCRALQMGESITSFVDISTKLRSSR